MELKTIGSTLALNDVYKLVAWGWTLGFGAILLPVSIIMLLFGAITGEMGDKRRDGLRSRTSPHGNASGASDYAAHPCAAGPFCRCDSYVWSLAVQTSASIDAHPLVIALVRYGPAPTHS
jgi:hypothetical protein